MERRYNLIFFSGVEFALVEAQLQLVGPSKLVLVLERKKNQIMENNSV